MADAFDKLRMMEDEMNKFEEEIGIPNYVDGTSCTQTYSQMNHHLVNPNGYPIENDSTNSYMESTLPLNSDKFSIMGQQNTMTSQGYNNMRPGFSNNQIQSQRRFNVKVDKTIGPVILSGAPKLYTSKPEPPQLPVSDPIIKPEDVLKMTTSINPLKKESKKSQPTILPGKEMAEAVKATSKTVVVSAGGNAVAAAECAASIPNQSAKSKGKKNKKFIRTSGGQVWEDQTLSEWDEDDFRLFCGDLGNDVTDELLARTFSRYPSFQKARVVRDRRTMKTRGFGFVSFKDPADFIRATKELNGRYVGSRPIKLRKSMWKNRSLEVTKKKEKEKAALINLLTGQSS
ncbi:RBM42, RNA recognition motif,RNA recognition motif domain [Cinara cedri]|uniref:RNA-binding protein 42 n=1 Tax=Cinara cedri TaxID=506608 RepID=A0A5E4NCK6_9HEMI|nr:RBM42, RNA recognition motif,RNA recognition motif domain [Cinara cedri]